jgi:predicted HTH transcriptional regulator
VLPKQLLDWTVQVVIDLLQTGMFESESFDYKEALPHSKDETGKDRLRRACCAFANSDGGFLVFGISDDKTEPPENRLVGLDKSHDFPEQFGNYPRSCSPSIYLDFGQLGR